MIWAWKIVCGKSFTCRLTFIFRLNIRFSHSSINFGNLYFFLKNVCIHPSYPIYWCEGGYSILFFYVSKFYSDFFYYSWEGSDMDICIFSVFFLINLSASWSKRRSILFSWFPLLYICELFHCFHLFLEWFPFLHFFGLDLLFFFQFLKIET